MKDIYAVFDNVNEEFRLQKKYLDDIEKLGECYAEISKICYDLDIDENKKRDYNTFISHVLMKLKNKIAKESREAIVVPVYNRYFTCEYLKHNDNEYYYTYTSTDGDYKFTEIVDHILDENELMNRLEYIKRKDQQKITNRVMNETIKGKKNPEVSREFNRKTPYKSDSKRQVFTRDNINVNDYAIKINDKEYKIKKYYDPQSKCYRYSADNNSGRSRISMEMLSDTQLTDEELAKWIGGLSI